MAALALPIAAAFVSHGGFFARGQVAFSVAAVSTWMAVFAIAGGTPAALRSPPVLALAGLGVLSAVSAAWTVASTGDAVRWGAVVAALALIAVSATVVSARVGPMPIAAVIAIAAAGAGAVGLYGAGARVEPIAQRLTGHWTPGGPLEYSPALALLQVSALPVLFATMARARDCLAATAAMGAGIAGAVVALAGSRVELAIAIGIAVACSLTAPRLIQVRPTTIVAAASLGATAGGAADAVAGSYADPYVTAGGGMRLAGLAAIAIGSGGLWLLQRSALDAARSGRRFPRAVPATAVAVPLAAALLAAALTPSSGPQSEPVSGFTHGRIELAEAAIETASDRPFEGFGSLAFYEASRPYQDPPAVRFAHNLPLETWVELGVGGALLVTSLYVGSAALVWSRRQTAGAWLLGPAVVAFLAANLFDWPWHIPASGAVFALALGGIVGTVAGATPRSHRAEAREPANGFGLRG